VGNGVAQSASSHAHPSCSRDAQQRACATTADQNAASQQARRQLSIA